MAPASQVFNPSHHLFGIVNLPDQDEAQNELTDGLGVLGTKRDAGVRDARGVETEKILVLGKENAALGKAVRRQEDGNLPKIELSCPPQ